jgi:hypothetical protein
MATLELLRRVHEQRGAMLQAYFLKIAGKRPYNKLIRLGLIAVTDHPSIRRGGVWPVEAMSATSAGIALIQNAERMLGEQKLHRELVEAMLPCPFCGKSPDATDPFDVLRQERDGWSAHCTKPSGGCSASVQGESREGTAKAWNRRPSTDPAPSAEVASGARCEFQLPDDEPDTIVLCNRVAKWIVPVYAGGKHVDSPRCGYHARYMAEKRPIINQEGADE